jgi:hypothetical protein
LSLALETRDREQSDHSTILAEDERLGDPPRVIRGILQHSCEDILSAIFKQMRGTCIRAAP